MKIEIKQKKTKNKQIKSLALCFNIMNQRIIKNAVEVDLCWSATEGMQLTTNSSLFPQ